MLPFSNDEFVAVFTAYNTAIWPAPIFATSLGLAAIAALIARKIWSDRIIAAILAALWVGMGIGYHWLYFSAVNSLAYVFGGLFVVAGLGFFVEGVVRDRLSIRLRRGPLGWAAAALMIYAIVVYPLVGLFATHPYPATPLFGVAPCPTAIFTIAVLLLATGKHSIALAAVPIAWSIVGGSAAILLDVPMDYGLFVAGSIWGCALIFGCFRWRAA